AQALYAIFGDRRKLHGGETQLCYEWVEQLGLPREVVLMLVQHCMSTRGTQFSFKEAQKLALELCEQHVTTIEAAEDVFSRSEAAWKGTQKVLRRMSKFRAPTIDEIDLYVKWTTDWGFAPKAVETACAEMTGGDPSFKYLDSILKGLHERAGRGATSATQLEKQLTDEKRETEAVREVLAAAGLSTGVVSAGLREIYRDMAALVDHGTIVLAAREVGRTKRKKSLDVIEELVKSWHARGLTNEEDVRAYLQLIEEQNRRLKALYLLAGSEKSPNAADRELLRKWRIDWSFTDDVLELAAQYSAGADRPSSFMNKILESWRAAGVDTPQKAAADHEKHAERYAAPAPKEKTVIEQQYHQREYKPGQFDGLTEAELEEVRKFES
ncbi:MAG: DnaD domain protein, partial [Eubacteriales bacterium]|nr:DnaD domain protein [Eubacteriales bacterium]